MKEKIEIKPLEQKPDKKESEEIQEIKTWESEGGTVEAEEETSAEVPETVVEEEKVKTSWREILIHAKEKFPEDIKYIIDKAIRKGKLTSREVGLLDSFSYRWFRETFGIIKRKQPQKELM